MKKIVSYTLFLLLVISFTSCLKMGLDELPTSDKADITNVKFEYRWWDKSTEQLRVVELTTSKEIVGHTINCTITVPAVTDKFTAQIREGVSLSNLVCLTDISAAASISPIGGAPALGAPGDFSKKEFNYLIVAADGSNIEWRINIIALNK